MHLQPLISWHSKDSGLLQERSTGLLKRPALLKKEDKMTIYQDAEGNWLSGEKTIPHLEVAHIAEPLIPLL